jgi:anti-sigma factor (TIGR02949 family)
MSPIDRYTCEETFLRLDDYLDRELTAEEMELVREHLKTCAVCAAEYSFEGSLLQEIRNRLGRLAAPADLLQKVQGALDRMQADRVER